MGYPRFQRARAFKYARRSSGNILLNSTAWTNVDAGLDLTLDAQVGDVIECGLQSMFLGESVAAFLDVASLVGGTPQRYFSSGAAESATSQGAPAWIGLSAVYTVLSGSVWLTLAAGDISNGLVTVRLRGRTNTATNRTLFANPDQVLTFFARNLGPVDPN